MPLIEVTLVEGRSPQQVRTLISELTDAVVRSVGARKESVRVVVHEVPATHWAAGDRTIAERAAESAEGGGPSGATGRPEQDASAPPAEHAARAEPAERERADG